MDSETRRRKQQELMVQLVERKVRSRAQELYEARGQAEGQELKDWYQAESEVLEDNILAPLYRRLRTKEDAGETVNPPNPQSPNPPTSESAV